MLNFSASGKDVEVRQHQLPQFQLVDAKEIDAGIKGVEKTIYHYHIIQHHQHCHQLKISSPDLS
jgi:hypothetical protein